MPQQIKAMDTGPHASHFVRIHAATHFNNATPLVGDFGRHFRTMNVRQERDWPARSSPVCAAHRRRLPPKVVLKIPGNRVQACVVVSVARVDGEAAFADDLDIALLAWSIETTDETTPLLV